MNEQVVRTILETFGYVGLALLGCYAVFRAVWPTYRDKVIPAKIEAIKEAAAAQTRIATAVESMAAILYDIRDDVIDIKLDQARIFVLAQEEQPSSSRQRPPRQPQPIKQPA